MVVQEPELEGDDYRLSFATDVRGDEGVPNFLKSVGGSVGSSGQSGYQSGRGWELAEHHVTIATASAARFRGSLLRPFPVRSVSLSDPALHLGRLHVNPALPACPPMRLLSVPIRSSLSSFHLSPATSPYMCSLSPTMGSCIGVFPPLSLCFTSFFL
jgi:hypothetical protein